MKTFSTLIAALLLAGCAAPKGEATSAGSLKVAISAGADANKPPVFRDYDRRLLETIQSRWSALLDAVSYDSIRKGKVVLQFDLSYDGKVSDLKVLEETVGKTLSLICQKAVLDPAPYERWPAEMRLLVNKDFREIQFEFCYR